jgi:hypothetical protein
MALYRGYTATFTSSSTGETETFQYGDIVASVDSVGVECYTIPISTMVTAYDIRLGFYGLMGFKFSDYDGNLYLPCYLDCDDVLVYSAQQ